MICAYVLRHGSRIAFAPPIIAHGLNVASRS
jgi:hypothetical protein